MNPDMKRLKLLAAVAVLGVFACEEATPPPPVGSIVGQVAIEGTGIDGVSVNLSNGNSTTTSGGGSYRFDNVEGGAYTVTISGYPSDATFDQTSAAATISSAGQSVTINFTGSYIRTASVMGSVTVENLGLGGVTVALSGTSAATTVTDDNGQYAFTGLRMGNYSVEISGFNTDEVGFSSTSTAVSVGTGESKIVSFDGTYLRTAGIQGQVSVEGVGLEGVNVSLKGGPDGEDMTTTTDAAGLYSFAKLRAGDYSVGISNFNTDDYEFTVTSQNVTIALGETANVPFEGILRRTSGIAGRVSVGGMGIADVTVTVSGAGDGSTTTDASGQYAIGALAAGDYTVTISGYDGVEYSFEDSQDVTLAVDQTEIVNFSGTALRTASVSGMVTADLVAGGDPMGVADVDVTLTQVTGATSGTVLGSMKTGDDGRYSFGPLLAGSYRVDIAGFDAEIGFASTFQMTQVETAGSATADFPGTVNRDGSISGSVTVDGDGTGGVTVTLAGGDDMVDESMETGDDGGYSFTGLRRGDYTVTVTNPDEARYSFPTTERAVNVAIGQKQSADFAGTLLRQGSISGQVRAGDDPISAVSVMLSGASEAETATDQNGEYNFTGLAGGSYTVTITNPDEAAYEFAGGLTMDVDLGDSGEGRADFLGAHTRTASVSGMLFVDEVDSNDMHDEGEDALPAANIPLLLVARDHTAADRPALTDAEGRFTFSELRKGTYQLVVGLTAETAALVPAGYGYGGPAEGFEVEVGVEATATQNIPFDITHQTVDFSVALKHGDKEPGAALEGATVTFYRDNKGEFKITDGETGEDGTASITFARSEAPGGMVYASVMAPEAYTVMADPDGMQAVSWASKDKTHAASNADDIVNLNVDVTYGAAAVARDGHEDSGAPLANWAIDVMTGEGDDAVAVEDAPEELDADGMAHYTATVEAADLPVAYTFSVAEAQHDSLDGGEDFEGTAVEYEHDGLRLAVTEDAGMSEVTYTSQTLVVYVHHDRDQVPGYTGSVLGTDMRVSEMLDLKVRHVVGGRHIDFDPETEWNQSKNMTDDGKGKVTFTGVPADKDVVVKARAKPDLDIIVLDAPVVHGHNSELFAYRDFVGDDGQPNVKGGAFGAAGGYSNSVELCPLQSVDPTNQFFGKCGSFAYVNTYRVHGTLNKQVVELDDEGGSAADQDFKGAANFDPVDDPKDATESTANVDGKTFDMTGVAGRNLAGAGEVESGTTAKKNDKKTSWNDINEFDFGKIAEGHYAVGVPAGWDAALTVGGPVIASSLDDPAKEYHVEDSTRVHVRPETGYVYGKVWSGTTESWFGVKDVTVTVDDQKAMTDEHGRFIVEGYYADAKAAAKDGDGKTEATTYAKGDAVATVTIDWDGAEKPIPMTIKFAKNDPIRLNVQITDPGETAMISGRVTGSDGQGVAGVEILVGGKAPSNAATSGANKGKLLTDDEGNYEAQVGVSDLSQFETATKNVTAKMAGRTFVPRARDALVGRTIDATGVNFQAWRNGIISGRVVRPGGTNSGPLQGVTVRATPTDGTYADPDSAVTGTDGRYALSVSPQLTSYTITAELTGHTFDYPGTPDNQTVGYVGEGATVSYGDIYANPAIFFNVSRTSIREGGGEDPNVQARDSVMVIMSLSKAWARTNEDLTLTVSTNTALLTAVNSSAFTFDADGTDPKAAVRTDTLYFHAVGNVTDNPDTLAYLKVTAETGDIPTDSTALWPIPDSVKITITDDDTPPDAMSGVTAPADSATHNTIVVKWTGFKAKDPNNWGTSTNAATRGFEYRIVIDGAPFTGAWTDVTDSADDGDSRADEVRVAIPDRAAETRYKIQIRAESEVGGGEATVVTVTTKEAP